MIFNNNNEQVKGGEWVLVMEIDELSRAIGNFESSIKTLFHNQDRLIISIDKLDKSFNRRIWFDSVKVVMGGVVGGFAAVIGKTYMS